MVKLDTKGNYLEFKGYTIIGFLETDISEWFTELSNLTNKDEISILPYDSLHMTYYNLCNDLTPCPSDYKFNEIKSYISKFQQHEVYVKDFNLSTTYGSGIFLILDIDQIDRDPDIDFFRLKARKSFGYGYFPKQLHLTLGYSTGKLPSKERHLQLVKHLDSIIGKKLLISKPKLVSFDTMEAYVLI